jgi:hypothetical protein
MLVVNHQPAVVTTNEGNEGSGLEGNTAPLIPQTSVLRENASQAAGPNTAPVTASVKGSEPTENTGAVFDQPRADISGFNNARGIAERGERSTDAGTPDGLAVTLMKMFLSLVVGLTVAGVPYGIVTQVVTARRTRALNVRRDLVARLHARLQNSAAEKREPANRRLEDIATLLESIGTTARQAKPGFASLRS